jgi:hypothetical protein
MEKKEVVLESETIRTPKIWASLQAVGKPAYKGRQTLIWFQQIRELQHQ